ncbi:hypothetical protein EYF80_011394 [Liparis tanakae]|uniref:Uncharacterized protein n=1 Tax=Liparis tanakae TaxID=230148 RepID=A0A4Z2IK76_9TELE|nr:hypothetical protein EYF80_011394 [Liparis tanakae]
MEVNPCLDFYKIKIENGKCSHLWRVSREDPGGLEFPVDRQVPSDRRCPRLLYRPETPSEQRTRQTHQPRVTSVTLATRMVPVSQEVQEYLFDPKSRHQF